MPTDPALSVVLASSGSFANIRTTVYYLKQQTIAAQIELIIVAPTTSDFGLPSDAVAAFYGVKLIGLGRLLPISYANAEGVRYASGPVIVFAEDHALPEEDWAQALLGRHQDGYAVVGPAVRNANPTTAVSWADFFLSYGPWRLGRSGGEVRMLPGHNSSYKKSILVDQGDNLAASLEAESVFHEALRKKSERLFFEPRAIIAHLNFARLGVLLQVQFHYGRNYAARRCASWSLWKRLIYFLGSPMIPLVRLVRIFNQGFEIRNGPPLWRVLAVLVADLVADGLGQTLGYLCGSGRSAEILINYEYDRVRFVLSSELPAP